ncbi:MAG: DUF6247 family protein [Pseudonocardiaceae bacterium]
MTAAAMKIECSGPAIRASLARFAPRECAAFEAELARAIGHAAETFDLAPAEAVLDRWWGVAVIRANPLSEQEQAQVARARAGDFTGLLARDARGDWVRL